MTENYYQILGLDFSCSSSDIDNAYRELAKIWHPDKNQNRKDAAEKKFREISKAYQVLSDEKQRKNYDAHGVSEAGNLIDPYAFYKDMFDTEDNSIPNVIIGVNADLSELYLGFTRTI